MSSRTPRTPSCSVLLAFGDGHAVTAVGPNQSIYGFRERPRGSSSTSSAEFPHPRQRGRHRPPHSGDREAAGTGKRSGPALRRGADLVFDHRAATGATSWPRPSHFGAAEQSGGEPGAAGARETADAVEVPPLQPSPAAVEGRVDVGRFATDEAEAAAIAGDVLKFRVTDFDAQHAAELVPPAMAVLCRRRAQMECIRREFEVRGIPYEIVGLGGLLDTPEIIDLVATLRVLADPGRSDSLMRLLAGARRGGSARRT